MKQLQLAHNKSASAGMEGKKDTLGSWAGKIAEE